MATGEYPIIVDWYTDNLGRKTSILKTNETYTIVNNHILLMEIPDKYYGVKIIDFIEIKNGSPITSSNQYKVNYNNGQITFDPSKEGNLVTVSKYYSRGVMRISASHIYTKRDDSGSVVQTLENLIELMPSDSVSYATKEEVDEIRTSLGYKMDINMFEGNVTTHYHISDRDYDNLINRPTIPTDTSQLYKSDVYTKEEVDSQIGSIVLGSGNGDMSKLIYDTNNDGIVDQADSANSIEWVNVKSKPIIPTDTNQLTKTDVYTKSEVDQKIVNVSSGGSIDLSNYATKQDISTKVDKVTGKQLSTEDYTTNEKTKLSGIETNANNYIHPDKHPASMITTDMNNRFVSDAEKSMWNTKQSALSGDVTGHYHSSDRSWTNITGKPSMPNITSGTSAPTGGSNGDIYIQYT